MIRHSLSKSALDVLDAYWSLKAAENKYVRCPYFRNLQNGRYKWGLTAYSGKGSPREIEDELKIIEKLEGVDFSQMRECEIRDIMKKRKLGIECSGFITRVLDGWSREFYKKPIYSLIKFETRGLGSVFVKMRPYTHIRISTLTSSANAREVNDSRDIMPGDLIKFTSTIDHAALIVGTERDDIRDIKRVYYAHSVLENSNEGIKKGVIEFTNRGYDLLSQKWNEEPETGHTILGRGKPQVYRLYVMESFDFARHRLAPGFAQNKKIKL